MATHERSKIYRKGRTSFDITKMPMKPSTLQILWGYLVFIANINKMVSDEHFFGNKMQMLFANAKTRLVEIAKRAASREFVPEKDYRSVASTIRDAINLFFEEFEGHMAGATLRFADELKNLTADDAGIVERYAGTMADLQESFREKLNSPKEWSYAELVGAYNAVGDLMDKISDEIEAAKTDKVLSEHEAEGNKLLLALQAA